MIGSGAGLARYGPGAMLIAFLAIGTHIGLKLN
jgi:amino acid permease